MNDSTGPDRIPLTWDQVKAGFPAAAAAMEADYESNLEAQAEDYVLEPMTISPPDKVEYHLIQIPPESIYAGSLPDHPGYALEAYDPIAPSGPYSEGTQFWWTGEEWEI